MGKVEPEFRINFCGELDAWHPVEDGSFGTSFTAFGRQGQRCLLAFDSTGSWMTQQCGMLAVRVLDGVDPNNLPDGWRAYRRQ